MRLNTSAEKDWPLLAEGRLVARFAGSARAASRQAMAAALRWRRCIYWLSLLAVILVPMLVRASSVDSIAPGSYRCASYNVSGGGGSCRNMQPLVLNADGSYQFSSTRGQWLAEDGKLLLSGSQLWGKGQLLGHDTVRFEYDYRGWRHVVTWTCQACGSATPPPTQHADAAVSAPERVHVGVSLTLQFDQAIGGVSGFVIVPAGAARDYGHNAPLPANSVQGLAWESGGAKVSLATGQHNKLLAGQRYVVFLSWPRETIAVAILDLTATRNESHTAVLTATLEGASVLARL